jgi:hypothetical protein
VSALARPSRETVFSTLFALLQNADGFTTYSRRMLDYSEIAPRLLPALILWELHGEVDRTGRGLRREWWDAMIVGVFQNPSRPQNGDPTTAVPGATLLNPLVDSVSAVLEADDQISNELTLNGLVQWVRIEGKLVVETGDTDADGRGGFILPLRVLVP